MKVFIPVVAMGMLAAGCTGGGNEPTDGVGTGAVIPKPGSSLIAVDGTTANDVWAVGETHGKTFRESSLIEHWDGQSWSTVAAPDVGVLGAIATVTADDAWALGSGGVLHWDGSTWREVTLPRGNGNQYSAISASGQWEGIWLRQK